MPPSSVSDEDLCLCIWKCFEIIKTSVSLRHMPFLCSAYSFRNGSGSPNPGLVQVSGGDPIAGLSVRRPRRRGRDSPLALPPLKMTGVWVTGFSSWWVVLWTYDIVSALCHNPFTLVDCLICEKRLLPSAALFFFVWSSMSAANRPCWYSARFLNGDPRAFGLLRNSAPDIENPLYVSDWYYRFYDNKKIKPMKYIEWKL